MSNWRYTDGTNTIAARSLDNGSMESILASALPEGTAVLPCEPPPADRPALLAQIDADVDDIYSRVIGNRAAEYEQAEREALAYQTASFAGAAPPMVQAWADAKGWTGQQAAQDIITQATAWRGAQTQIRAQRLLRKEQVRTAADDAAVHAAVAAWAQALGQIKAALGVA